MDEVENKAHDVPKATWMSVGTIASDIYCSMVVDLLKGRGKPWELKPQELLKLADKCCAAEDAFVSAINAYSAAKSQSKAA